MYRARQVIAHSRMKPPYDSQSYQTILSVDTAGPFCGTSEVSRQRREKGVSYTVRAKRASVVQRVNGNFV